MNKKKKNTAGFSKEIQGRGNSSAIFITAIIVTLLLTLTAYRRALDNEFVDWDDFTYVVNNNLVRSQADTVLGNIFSTPVSSNYHPLTILSLRLNNNSCQACPYGISPAPFIRWNIIIHLLNTFLVFLLIYRLSGKKVFVSFFVAAVFGVHPLHVESVAWISERKDVLYSFFFISGLLSYLAFKNKTRNRVLFYLLTFILFVFSCLSKAVAVVFPLVLLLIDFWTEPQFEGLDLLQAIKKLLNPRRILLTLPFLLVSLFIGLLAFHLQNGENFLGLMRIEKSLPDVVNTVRKLTIFQRIGVGCEGLVSYLVKFFLPFKLSAIYPYPPAEVMKSAGYIAGMVASFLVTIAGVVITLVMMKKTRVLLFGAGFFFITIVLVLQFISVGIALKADRYTYLPYTGLAFIFAMLFEEKLRGWTRQVMIIISGFFIVFLWLLTSRQADVWQNTETLWSDVIMKYPEAETPRASRGKYYIRKSLSAKSVREKAYFEEKAMADFMVAIKVKTKNTDVYEGLGYILASRGDFKRALEYFNLAIIADPENGSAYYNRALVYTSLNMTDEAIKDYTTALKYSPEKKKEIITNRSNLLLETGRFREVIGDLDYLVSLESFNPNHYFNRATARLVTGDIRGAATDLQQVLLLNPADREALELLKKIQSR